jgi:hypothetical protein
MSDIIYTPPASGGGGGTTINPTNNFIPVRSNATTFIDSVLENGSDYLKSIYSTNDIGLYLDFSNSIFEFGDFNSINSGTSFFIDDASSLIYTKHSGQQEGLFFDFVNDYFQIGDFGNTNKGTFLNIDDDNQFIASYTNGNSKGLRLDFLNDQFALGDYNALSNGNYVIVDNTGVNEVVICANTQLNIKGSNIQLNSSLNYQNENLKVKAPDGNIYYIPLYN